MILIIKHVECEGPGTFGDFLKANGLDFKTVDLGEGESLPPADKCDAVISLGGPMNVYEEDKYPFLKKENEFVREIVGKEIPFLGICLGGQILAKALNAEVRKAPRKEIGWYTVRINNDGINDPMFKNLYSELAVFQWHEDTFDVPENGILLAESITCRNQVFKYGKNAYGFQFHIEVSSSMIEEWINVYKGECQPGIDTRRIRGKYYSFEKMLKKQSRLIFFNFLNMANL